MSSSSFTLIGKEYNDKESLLAAAKRLYWCSYRRDFAPLGDNALTSDVGWGCMIRTAQMLLATCSAKSLFQREHATENKQYLDWPHSTLSSSPTSSQSSSQSFASVELKVRREIALLFADSVAAPYSIHNACTQGIMIGKDAGAWFGPATISTVLQRLAECVDDARRLVDVRISMDGMLSLDDFERKPCSFERPALLLLQLRLGLNAVNPIYFELLERVMRWPQCIGVIGGRPNSSFYFVGVGDGELFYLDPHCVQPALSADADALDAIALGTLTSPNVASMPFDELDPSLAVGFYLDSAASLDELIATAHHMESTSVTPLFGVHLSSKSPTSAASPTSSASSSSEASSSSSASLSLVHFECEEYEDDDAVEKYSDLYDLDDDDGFVLL
jgi:cysteine protease ATG4